MRTVLFLILLTVGSLYAEEPKYAPTKDIETRQGYWFSYDGRARNPRWTLEHFTAKSLIQNVSRDSNPFKGDEGVLKEARALPSDYAGTGYDQGHCAAADGHRSSEEEIRGTFLMTNMIPQKPECNRAWWKQLEELTRSYAKSGADVWVVSIPIYSSEGSAIEIKTIGKHRVWVPTHCAKTVLIQKAGKVEVKAWVGPNGKVDGGLESLEVPVDKLEELSGFDFWHGIANEDDLEK